MAHYRFSALANRITAAPECVIPPGGLSQVVSAPSKILRECDIPNIQWSAGLNTQPELVGTMHTSTKASAIPEIFAASGGGGGGGTVSGGGSGGGSIAKKPPPVLEWNPMVHTEWQLGVGARLLPKLPEGTKVGKLVMGKYGLYKPGLHEKAMQFFINTELKGMAPEQGLPSFALLSKIARILLIFPLLTALTCTLPSIWAQKPAGLYAGRKMPGQH